MVFVIWNIGFYGSRHCHGRPIPYHRKLIGQKYERLVAKSDQQFIMNLQEHNRSWKVWIDVMRLFNEMCHVLLAVLACYRVLSHVIVTGGLSVPLPRL